MTFGGPAGAWELPKIIAIEAEYFEPNRERMRNPVFRAQGLFVGSGVVEAGCRTVIGAASNAPECFGPFAHRRPDHPFKCRAPSHFHRALIAKKSYNSIDAPHVGIIADGSVQLFADQSRGVRIGLGFKNSALLPARWKASLRDDGDAIGIAVRSLRAVWQMPFFPGRSHDSRCSGRELT
jgi:hypothetical protein